MGEVDNSVIEHIEAAMKSMEKASKKIIEEGYANDQNLLRKIWESLQMLKARWDKKGKNDKR